MHRFLALLAALLLTMPAGAAEITIDALMDWAQRTYPAYFPGSATTQAAPPYLYRYYPSTGNYIGVAGADVYVLGPVSAGELLRVGAVADFRCRVSPPLCEPASAARVFAGQGMSAVVGVDGRLIMWGNPADYRLAAGTPLAGSTARTVPIKTKQLAITTFGALVLDEAGSLHAWGSVQAWWLPVRDVDIPQRIVHPKKARQIAAGGHTGYYQDVFVLFEDGTVETIGSGPAGLSAVKDVAALHEGAGMAHAVRTNGQVIRLINDNHGAFRAVEGASDVASLSCAGAHCLGLNKDGTVIAWGNDTLLLDRVADPVQRKLKALPIEGLSNIVKVATGDGPNHGISVALSADGRLFTWGQLAGGGIGIGVFRTTEGPQLGRVTDVACANHCIARTDDGALWVWGFDKLAMTGTGKSSDRVAPPMRLDTVPRLAAVPGL